MKKILVFVLFIVMLFSISGCKSNKETINTDALKFKEAYESYNGKVNESNNKEYRKVNIPSDNPFAYKTMEEVVGMIKNKETFVVYFGFNTCPWCRSVIEQMIEAASNLKIDKIYYVDIRPNGEDIRDVITVKDDGTYSKTKEGEKGYDELLVLLDNVLADYSRTDSAGNSVDVKEKRIYAPNLVSVLNGKAIKLETGISSKQNDAYMELTEEMKKETYSKLESVLKSNKTTCDSEEAC